ncbi:MAG: hypothetical protein Q8Q08_04510 [Candidatus Omnitrophota bacterium]|nr:hypothetical protein [Candidatus Omnitrophota bacterium]
MKIASIISISLMVVYAFLAILQIWFEIMSGANFFKLTLTFAILLVAAVVCALIRREYITDVQGRKGKYID